MQKVKRPRVSERGKKENKSTGARLLPIVAYALIIAMGVVCVSSVISIVQGFLRIKGFEVEGTERFAGSEMAAFGGLKRGDLLYDIDESATKANILKNCAYVEDVDFKPKMSGRLCFVIKEREPVWYIKISGDCYVLDKDLRALEETKDEAGLVEDGVTTLTMPHVKEAMVGDILVYGSSDEEIDNTEKIISSLSSSALGGQFTVVDIDNRYDIHLTVNGAFEVSLGSYSKLDVKLKYLAQILEKAYSEEAVGGKIDISDDASKYSAKWMYSEVESEKTENGNMG